MISGFSGSPAEQTSRSDVFQRRHVLLHEHAPHRRRRADRGDLVLRDGIQHAARVEARLVGDEHGGARIPRREEAAIGVLRPAGRGDVQVHVAGLQADPVHRDQMADRIALVAVLDQLRPRRGARGEIQQHRIGRTRLAIRREACDRRAAGRRSRAIRRARRRARCGSPSDRGRRTSAHRPHWRSDGEPGRARSGPSGRSASASVLAGITTAPSFIAASITSHSGTTLPSISRMRSPRLTPRARRPLATRLERSESSAKVAVAAPSPTIFSASRLPLSPRAKLGIEPVERIVEMIQLRPAETRMRACDSRCGVQTGSRVPP